MAQPIDNSEQEFAAVQQYISKLSQNISKEVKTTMQGIAEVMKATAVMHCPVAIEEGGRLRQSIESFVETGRESITGGAGTSVEYAAYVEFGTGLRGSQDPGPYLEPDGISRNQSWAGMAAQPYLRPALYDNEDLIRESIADGVLRGIQK